MGGGGQCRIIIALQAIMNGLLFAGLLCPHLFATTSGLTETNGGIENEQREIKKFSVDWSTDENER